MWESLRKELKGFEVSKIKDDDLYEWGSSRKFSHPFSLTVDYSFHLRFRTINVISSLIPLSGLDNLEDQSYFWSKGSNYS